MSDHLSHSGISGKYPNANLMMLLHFDLYIYPFVTYVARSSLMTMIVPIWLMIFNFLMQGGWENDETVEEAAAREAIEEAGVRGDLVVRHCFYVLFDTTLVPLHPQKERKKKRCVGVGGG